MVDSKGQNIYAILDSRIDRGFQLTNEGWLTYKHNYITVSSSFSLTTSNPVEYGVIPKSNIYAKAGNTQLMIRYFSLRMVAFQLNSNNTLTEREIFQQSAKRNQSVLYPSISVVPGKLPTHDYIKNNTTYRSLLRRKIIDHDISYRKTDLGPFAQYYPDPLGIHYVALFERLQFSGGDGQRCKLVIQLVAMLENEIPYVVSWSETPYFLLRSKSSFLYENQPATSKNWEDNAKTNSFSPSSPDSNSPPVQRNNDFYESLTVSSSSPSNPKTNNDETIILLDDNSDSNNNIYNEEDEESDSVVLY